MNRFCDYIVPSKYPISDAMSKMQDNEYKLLFLVDDGCALLGVMTDGDLRRFLLAGGSMSEAVEKAANSAPVFLEGYHEGAARKLMKERVLTCIPMTNLGVLHALVFENETLHRMTDELDIPVVIMAGGLGTRLLPYTDILPKPLIPVGGKTITEQIIERFKKFGCRDFTLVVNYKRNLIKTYFSECDEPVELTFVDETTPLGTGGGLCFLKGKIKGDAIVTNCDSVVEANYSDIVKVHRESGNAVTMVCAERLESIPYGVVTSSDDGELISIREKPEQRYLMNTGFYVINERFLNYVNDGEFQPITDILLRCKDARERVGVYTVGGDCFVDIGQLDDLRQSEELLK